MKNILLSDSVSNVIGTINSPVNDPLYKGNVNEGLGLLISTGIQLFFFVAGLATLLYLLWGAYDWISSSGEKEKLEKAQNKIMSAVIGLILVVVVVVVFNLLMGTVLGGKFGWSTQNNVLQFTLPHL